MPNKIRWSVALALLLVFVTPTSVNAESLSGARKKREATHAKRAQLASQVNELRASDAELEKAVGALDAQVKSQQAAAADARQAAEAAEAKAAAAEAKLIATKKEIASLRKQLVDRAVAAYVSPPESDVFTEIAESKDFNEASRRSSLLDQISNQDRDVLDRLHAARQDQADEKKQASDARDEANSRRKEEDERLGSLKGAQAEKQRLAAALDARIKEYESEAQTVAAQEGALSALISSKESELSRASRGPALSDGGGGGGGGRISGAGLMWPVNGPVTSEFGYRWGRLHAGIDIGAGSGTPIRAAKAGTVIFAGTMNGYGNVVIVDHGGGFSTLYAHQSRLGSSDGQSVSQGQVIGYVGSTGHSTGPHLHFETRVNGSPQNPRRYL